MSVGKYIIQMGIIVVIPYLDQCIALLKIECLFYKIIINGIGYSLFTFITFPVFTNLLAVYHMSSYQLVIC